jgi:hypothetical protein
MLGEQICWGGSARLKTPFAQEATIMSVQENVALMRRWFKEVWNEGRTQTVYDLLAPDAVAIGQLEDGSRLPSSSWPIATASGARRS